MKVNDVLELIEKIMSWKTTFFGLMAAIGGAVMAAITTGVIDISDLPKWVKGIAGLMTVAGTAGLGFCARDNDKTSEQVGAGKNENNGSGLPEELKKRGSLAIVGGLGLALALGCSSARLESGGAYAPAVTAAATNGVGQVAAPDIEFYNVDALYQFAWHAANAAFDFEYQNRMALFSISPEVKRELDKIRPLAVKANREYLAARTGYLQNPTPAGLDTLGTLEAKLMQISQAAGALMPQKK